MNKKIAVIILVVILIFTASYFYLLNRNESASADNAVKNDDSQLIQNVVEVEKNIALTQLERISFDDFRDNTGSFFDSIYRDSYFDELESIYNQGGDIAVTTKLPLYHDISKVYTDADGKSKYVFVVISDERFANLSAKMYTFINNDGEWKIRIIKNYVLSKDMKSPEKDAEKFTSFNGTPIEYETIKILE